MSKGKPLTCRGFISIDGAPYVPLESLTPEQIAYCNKKMSDRLSKGMSEYFSLHPEQYAQIKDRSAELGYTL